MAPSTGSLSTGAACSCPGPEHAGIKEVVFEQIMLLLRKRNLHPKRRRSTTDCPLLSTTRPSAVAPAVPPPS